MADAEKYEHDVNEIMEDYNDEIMPGLKAILIISFVVLVVLALAGYYLHLQILKSGWAENIDGKWQLVAYGWNVYKYAWKGMAVGFLFGTATSYLFAIYLVRETTTLDFREVQKEFNKKAEKLSLREKVIQKQTWEVEQVYHEGQAEMEKAKELVKSAEKRAAFYMKQVEKIKNELKGARARAYRKIKKPNKIK